MRGRFGIDFQYVQLKNCAFNNMESIVFPHTHVRPTDRSNVWPIKSRELRLAPLTRTRIA